MFLWKNLTLITINGVYIKLTSRVKKPDRYINGPDKGIQPFTFFELHETPTPLYFLITSSHLAIPVGLVFDTFHVIGFSPSGP